MTRDEAIKKMKAVKAYMIAGNPIWDVTEMGEAFDMAIEALEQLPTIEFVPSVITVTETPMVEYAPVVRCKDCRWKEREEPGMVYCPATVGGWVDEDFFCKGGERSEDGET